MAGVGVLLFMLLAGANAVAAEAVQSPESIQQAARLYLEAQFKDSAERPTITVVAPDQRLRLAQCESPLEAFSPPGQRGVGATSVGVRCPGPTTWTLYVQATVALYRQVLVTTRPLMRGQPLSGDAVRLEARDVTRLTQGYLTDIKSIDGMLAKRSIPADTVLGPALVQAPIAIRRGEKVVLLAQGGGVEVRMEGRALADAAVGEPVRVRNLSSGRVVEGVVVSPGVVGVRF